MADKTLRFLISGGGTGGHVYPAIAIADALMLKRGDAVIEFAGSRDRIEWKAVPAAGYRIHPIWISGLQRRLTIRNLLVPVKLAVSLVQSLRIISRLRPDAVICTGGYVCGPVGWMAGKRGIPLFLQEQNGFPGVTTRLLSGMARRVFTAFGAAGKYLPKAEGRIVHTGNPTRSQITAPVCDNPHASFGLEPGRKTLLVLGGSGGAAAVNNAVLLNLDKLHNEQNLQILWQCGSAYLEKIRETADLSRYPRVKLTDFIDDMAAAYATADLVLSRAGAGICTELLIAGKASVLMPSPNVAGDHQTQNARALESGGAALLLSDSDAAEKLAGLTEQLFSDEGRVRAMEHAAKAMARPDAASVIADEILTLIEHQPENVS